MGNVMVDVNHVSIRFIQNQEKVDNLKEYFIKLVTRKLKYDDFWALTDVNFQIEKGERLGVLGFNGAGKSTLLKTVAGVLKPTKGSVTTKGVIAPLLELGAGFDMNYTGKENVYLYGATEQVRRLCNKAIILDHGKMIASGTSDEVCDIYDRMVKGIK